MGTIDCERREGTWRDFQRRTILSFYADFAYSRPTKMPATANRRCFRDPIPEIAQAALLLDKAVSAHLSGKRAEAEELICRADLPAIREWTESLWGRNSRYVTCRPLTPATSPATSALVERQKFRMTAKQKTDLLLRDGYHCRFCGIPVIRREIREKIKKFYPVALKWGNRNADQHAAFQAMWVQYDHIIPRSIGGTNDLSNLIVTYAPCNFARMDHTLEEVGLLDPRDFEPVRSSWDGLERFR